MKTRFIELAQSAGLEFANAVFSHVSASQRQLWATAM